VNISTKLSIASKSRQQINYGLKKRTKAAKKFWSRRGSVILKVSALVVFSAVLLIGTQDIGRADSETPTARISSSQRYGSTSVDEIAGANVAAEIARASSLVIADSITNLADSLGVQVQLAGTDTEPYLENPSLIQTDAKTREDITTYTVKPGETVGIIAKKFGITSDTIRWENNIIGDAIASGRKIRILPVSGLTYKVKSGDTAKSLADKYKTSSAEIVAFNDAEIDGLPVGETIIIPNGKKPATVAYYGYTSGYRLTYGGNGYTYGYCTWHVANRRAAVGNPLPRGLGNAITWYALAEAGGMSVGFTPKAGAVAWHNNIGGLGHVGFVEKVNDDGSIWISDMNYHGHVAMDEDSALTGGWNHLSYRLVPKTEFSQFVFIY